MKEECNEEFLDLRRFKDPINPLELIKDIISNSNIDNDPFYVVDLEDICNKHINWITRLPRVEPHYAVKCNTDQMLLKLLAFLGTSFDCASKTEIQKVLDLGVSPHRIIFANPCKQASNIKFAYKKGVDYMTFDNENELYKIKECHPNAKIVLRIITDDKDAVCAFSMKFGADMPTAYKLIKIANDLDLDLVGISFHCGSGQMDPKSFSESISNARHLFDYSRENYGYKMHLLDIGGGYPGDSNGSELFNMISEEINNSLEKYFPHEYFDQINGIDEKKLRVIAEPGRYYAASAFTLCVNVIAKRVMDSKPEQQLKDCEDLANLDSKVMSVKEMNNEFLFDATKNTDLTKSIMYYINDGVYASFNCLFYDHSIVEPILLGEKAKNEENLYKSSIWGPTCDGLDLINKECYIPELQVGEFIAYKDMGAYTISGAVAFNGIPLARCIYTASTSWDTIKYAFTDSNDDQILNFLKTPITVSSNTCSAVAGNIKFSQLSLNNDKNEPVEINHSAEFNDECTFQLHAS